MRLEAELTGCSPCQQRPPECHLGHQGKPVKQRGQEHPEHPGRQRGDAAVLQAPVFTYKGRLAFPAAWPPCEHPSSIGRNPTGGQPPDFMALSRLPAYCCCCCYPASAEVPPLGDWNWTDPGYLAVPGGGRAHPAEAMRQSPRNSVSDG